jgi:hypothetical protein
MQGQMGTSEALSYAKYGLYIFVKGNYRKNDQYILQILFQQLHGWAVTEVAEVVHVLNHYAMTAHGGLEG